VWSFLSYQWKSYLLGKVFKHTHCMSWVIYWNFLTIGKSLCWLNSELFIISLHSFEMLCNCFISWLYMRALKLILGKIFYANFSSVSVFFSVKRLDGTSFHPDRCGSDSRTVMLQVRMRTAPTAGRWGYMSGRGGACRMLMWQRASRRVNEPSGRGPHSF
jgi:hypothetical protein